MKAYPPVNSALSTEGQHMRSSGVARRVLNLCLAALPALLGTTCSRDQMTVCKNRDLRVEATAKRLRFYRLRDGEQKLEFETSSAVETFSKPKAVSRALFKVVVKSPDSKLVRYFIYDGSMWYWENDTL
jgi:hypothetical protein